MKSLTIFGPVTLVASALFGVLLGGSCSKAAAEEGSPSGNEADAVEFTTAQIRGDFALMRAALEEAHPGLYRYSSRAEMDRVFASQSRTLNHPMRSAEFMAVIAKTLGAIRCGHTSFSPDEKTRTAIGRARLFPMRMLLEGGRWKVLLNDTPDDQAIRPGMELLEVNGHRMIELLRRFEPMESADGDIETGKRMQFGGRFGVYYWWLVEQIGDFTVKARDEAGRIVNGWRRASDFLALRRNTVLLLAALVLAGTGERLWLGFAPKYLDRWRRAVEHQSTSQFHRRGIVRGVWSCVVLESINTALQSVKKATKLCASITSPGSPCSCHGPFPR